MHPIHPLWGTMVAAAVWGARTCHSIAAPTVSRGPGAAPRIWVNRGGKLRQGAGGTRGSAPGAIAGMEEAVAVGQAARGRLSPSPGQEQPVPKNGGVPPPPGCPASLPSSRHR